MKKWLIPITSIVALIILLTIINMGMKPANSEHIEDRQSSHFLVNLQVWKHSTDTSLRILFDNEVIYEDELTSLVNEVVSDSDPKPKNIGKFAVTARTEHIVLVEAKEVGLRSRLVWKGDPGSSWVVISYYSRTDQYKELPMITFSIQDTPAASK